MHLVKICRSNRSHSCSGRLHINSNGNVPNPRSCTFLAINLTSFLIICHSDKSKPDSRSSIWSFLGHQVAETSTELVAVGWFIVNILSFVGKMNKWCGYRGFEFWSIPFSACKATYHVFFFGVILCCLRYAYWETIHDLQNAAFSVLSSSILPTFSNAWHLQAGNWEALQRDGGQTWDTIWMDPQTWGCLVWNHPFFWTNHFDPASLAKSSTSVWI